MEATLPASPSHGVGGVGLHSVRCPGCFLQGSSASRRSAFYFANPGAQEVPDLGSLHR